MSLRTTPLRPSTSGPLDPSPGNGPAVSCGIRVVHVPVPLLPLLLPLSVVSVGLAGVRAAAADQRQRRRRTKADACGQAQKPPTIHRRAGRPKVAVKSAEIVVVVVRVQCSQNQIPLITRWLWWQVPPPLRQMCPELLALLGPLRPLDVGVQLIEERIEFLSRARPEFVQPNGAALERRPYLALLLRRQLQIACDPRRGVGW